MLLRNVYFRVGLIFGLFFLAVLVVMPRTPVTLNYPYINVDTVVGGYSVSFFDGRVVLDASEFKRGLDLDGGARVVLKADMSNIVSSDREAALDSARGVIERRVNFLGVSEPYIAPSKVGDEYRIIVEIPGVDDISAAVDTIGQTAQLKFKQLKPENEWTPEKFQEYYLDPTAWEDTGVTGADLKGVDVVYSQGDQTVGAVQQAAPQVQLRFSNEGRKKFEEVAKNNIGKPVGLFLDEDAAPLSAPIVNESLAEGLVDDPIISGNFDAKTADALSVQIRAGALPVPVEILEQETIGATLGEESVQQSLKAGLIGLAAVLIFMIIVYGRLGFVADFALILYIFIVLAIFKLVPVVLTLPGIAGFLLSVGMAVDANILIFERMREEISWGRPQSLAVKFGFDRAWTSIRDSNVSSLITAGILFFFGTGAVRGFALTLSIGILVSLFTSIVVTRTLIEFVGVGGGGIEKKKKSRFAKFIPKINIKSGKFSLGKKNAN
jgi:preprotein translocase subunit SecD